MSDVVDAVADAADLAAFIACYERRARRSKVSRQTYGPVLADSRASAGFRRPLKEILFPIVGARAQGARVWDIDGNEYIDIAMGFGVQLFGHAAPFIHDAVQRQLANGLYLGPQSPLAGTVARQIAALTGVARVCFCNSGTEAVMTAIRLARAATRRSKIAMFKWSYHGHFDGTLGRPRAGGGEVRTIPLAPGCSAGAVQDVLMLDYGEHTTFPALDAVAGDVAAVLVEPVQSLRPELQPGPFLRALRRWCDAHGAALIFDEILLGFRVHPGGAQAVFGVKADLVTYGKIVGGGLPIGIVGGRPEYLNAIDGGNWSFGDDSGPDGVRTFFAGTFNKNPLGMAVANAVLAKLAAEGGRLQDDLNRRTARLAERLNASFAAADIPLRVAYFGSMFRFTGAEPLDLFHYGLIERGIYVWEGRSCFLSTAHSDADIERIVLAAEAAARDWTLRRARPRSDCAR
jgi:glutamate-1-semialdehyde aminotransferase